jgi:hypothetical protein
MRRSLLQTFDDIYILDLHGNRKKHERTPDGSKDENVFDIQQGVAIGIFVKWRELGRGNNWLEGYPNLREKESGGVQGRREQDGGKPHPYISRGLGRVYHADLWGVREEHRRDVSGQVVLADGKYTWLATHDLESTQWTRLNPQAPFYLFSPQESQFLAEYSKGWSLVDIFQPGGDPAPGVVTCHDEFAISWTEQEACAKVERLLLTGSEEEARQFFRLCSQSQWQYHAAKCELEQDRWQNDVTEMLYRPFDRRWTIFNRAVAVHRRERVMKHMLHKTNIGLAIGRASHVIDQNEWDIAFCSGSITDFNLFRRGGHNLFPLYLYDTGEALPCRANLADRFIEECKTRLKLRWLLFGQGDLADNFGPEDVFAYMYALFYSPAYRQRYDPFLKIDFPRVPITSNVFLFRDLCTLGDRLVRLHLMEQHIQLMTAFPVSGSNTVVDASYEPSGKVWINSTQYVEGVPWEAWNFSIGGYQVCKKWLRDRRGQTLSNNDIEYYQQIVAILAESSTIMDAIDEAIKKYGGYPL